MRVEAQERIKHHPYYLEPGDTITVDDETGQYLVDNGWAKNADTGEIGEREGGPATLDIEKGALGVTDSNPED